MPLMSDLPYRFSISISHIDVGSYLFTLVAPCATVIIVTFNNPHFLKQAGAYTRPLLSSTYAVLVSEPVCVHFVESHDPCV
jgi:hypothetical protein